MSGRVVVERNFDFLEDHNFQDFLAQDRGKLRIMARSTDGNGSILLRRQRYYPSGVPTLTYLLERYGKLVWNVALARDLYGFSEYPERRALTNEISNLNCRYLQGDKRITSFKGIGYSIGVTSFRLTYGTLSLAHLLWLNKGIPLPINKGTTALYGEDTIWNRGRYSGKVLILQDQLEGTGFIIGRAFIDHEVHHQLVEL